MELKTKIKMIITAKTVCKDDRVIGSHFAADDIMIVVATHTKQLCVGFAEWLQKYFTVDFDTLMWKGAKDISKTPLTFTSAQLYDIYLDQTTCNTNTEVND